MKNPDEEIFFPLSYSYLLRLWINDAHSRHPQRIILINLQNGAHNDFENFDQLAEFLKTEPGGDPDSAEWNLSENGENPNLPAC